MLDKYLNELNNGNREEALLGIQEFLKDSGYLLASGEHGYDVIAPEDVEERDFKELYFKTKT